LAESPEVREACSKQLQNQSQPLLFKSAKDFIVRYVLLLIPSKSVPGSSNLLMISMDGLGTSASGIQVITAPTGEVTWSSSNADDLSLFHVDPKLLQETTAKAASSDLPGLFQDGDVFASYAAISNRWVLFSYGFRSQVLQSVRAIEFEFFWLLLGSSFLVILFARRLVARLAEPLLELSSAAQKVSEGNFSTRILASGDREFRTVQNAFNHMAEELTRLIEVAKLSSKMESELELAKSVQQLLLPPEFLEVGTHQIRSTVRAATQCGGDWWGCIPTSEANGKFILMIGDVTGHGVPSALVTAATQGGKSVLAEWIGKEPLLLEDPRKLLELFNRAVYESSDGRLTMSFLLCVFNPEKNELLVSNAGHNWPYLIAVNPKGGHTLSAIGAASPVLGADRFQKFEHLETYPWPVGSKLVLYTDGLIDCYQGDKNLFDKRALLRVLRDVMGDTPKNILEKIFQIRESNTAGLPQEDDITLVICSRGPV
jgi:serine phosphatase RsbU (regulator of sigma subunit)